MEPVAFSDERPPKRMVGGLLLHCGLLRPECVASAGQWNLKCDEYALIYVQHGMSLMAEPT